MPPRSPVLILVLSISVVAIAHAHGQVASDPADRTDPDSLVRAAAGLHATQRREDSDSALVLLRQAIEVDPSHPVALEKLAEAHLTRVQRYGLGEIGFDSASAAVERLRGLSEGAYWWRRGQLASLRGSPRLAAEDWAEALRHDPDNEALLSSLGARYFGMGRHDRSIPTHLRLVALNPQAYWAWIQLGYAYFQVGLYDDAMRAFDRALPMRPEEGNAIGGMILSRFAAGDTTGALAFADSVWRLRPDTALTWARLGEAHFLAGQFVEAERYLAGALERDSASSNQYTVRSSALPLAHIYAQTGRGSQIQPLLDRAYARADARLSTRQEPWNEYYNYSGLAALSGDHEQALRWLRTAHEAGMPGEALLLRDPVFASMHENDEFQEIVKLLQQHGVEIRRRIAEGTAALGRP